MSRRQIRGGIRIPGPRRTALPFGLKEQFHKGRQPGTQLVLLLLSPRYLPSRALAPLLPTLSGPTGRWRQTPGTPSFISLFRMSSSMHREEFTEIEQENQFNYKRNQKNEAKIRSA